MADAARAESIVVVDPEQLPAARELAAAHGVEVQQPPGRGIEPVVTVTLILTGAVTAVATVMRVLDERKGGQVVDLRPTAPVAFYRTPDVVYGTVVIVTTDGRVTVEVREPEGMFGKVVSTLAELLGAEPGAAEVARSAIETFGEDVSVETSIEQR